MPDGELPIRKWSIEIYFVRDDGKAVEASIFDKVMYELHPSFGPKRAKQSKSHLHSDQQPADRPPAKKDPPFRIDEEGWGEFEMVIHFIPLGKGAEIVVNHDLNFQQERYEVYHDLVGWPSRPPDPTNCRRSSRTPSPSFLRQWRALEEPRTARAVAATRPRSAAVARTST